MKLNDLQRQRAKNNIDDLVLYLGLAMGVQEYQNHRCDDERCVVRKAQELLHVIMQEPRMTPEYAAVTPVAGVVILTDECGRPITAVEIQSHE